LELDKEKKVIAREQYFIKSGICPYCRRRVRNWNITIGTFGNEKWFQDRIKEEHIDPKTGHKIGCLYQNKIITESL